MRSKIKPKPNQTKSTKPNLPNQTLQTKPTKPNLSNQNYHYLANQAYQTKPKLLVKAMFVLCLVDASLTDIVRHHNYHHHF